MYRPLRSTLGPRESLAIGGTICGEPVLTLKVQLPRGNHPFVPSARLLFSIILTPKVTFCETKSTF